MHRERPWRLRMALLGPYGGRKAAPTYQGWWRHVWTHDAD